MKLEDTCLELESLFSEEAQAIVEWPSADRRKRSGKAISLSVQEEESWVGGWALLCDSAALSLPAHRMEALSCSNCAEIHQLAQLYFALRLLAVLSR